MSLPKTILIAAGLTVALASVAGAANDWRGKDRTAYRAHAQEIESGATVYRRDNGYYTETDRRMMFDYNEGWEAREDSTPPNTPANW
jgi:hypothetical protein